MKTTEDLKKLLKFYKLMLLPKEVKKVKKKVDYKKLPYFETKVVKVRKKEKKKCEHLMGEWNPKKMTIECDMCGKILDRFWNEIEPKGNWVNGENLDKIKFPCFCSYKQLNQKYYGEIKVIKDGDNYLYSLYYIEKQGDECWIDCNSSLKNLIKNHDIHILKGKIVIFEEEE